MTDEYKSNPGEDILFTVAILAGLGFAAWKFGLLEKLGIIKPKGEIPVEPSKELPLAAANYTVKIPYVSTILKPILATTIHATIKKNSANTRALQDGLNKSFAAGLSVDGKWGTNTNNAFWAAVKKTKGIGITDKTLKTYKKIGIKVVTTKGKSVPIGRMVTYRRRTKPRTHRVRREGEKLYENIPYKINGKKKVARGNLFYSTREDNRFTR